ncbi:hypothetical protein [Ornithinimicrobium sp. INDO-MA30-4]|uniref:hypothetical protein n=1 Tax=Ornithinimicrobium sp. INDO-MA30-4 TaxID=2908651 RepID=UPI001F2CB122|nr:hypothetical protein [Ornithinimicrobium sp. INDO-MA30-4]UJH71506.1 hypothetical protein L0A91_07460 [Ornithinimicrobium sp. INDO-MA30-4]
MERGAGVGDKGWCRWCEVQPWLPVQSIPAQAEAVWVSFAGVALECSLWWGAAVESPGRSVVRSLAGGGGEWVRLGESDVASSWPTNRVWPDLEPGMFLYDPDKAALAADLLGAVASVVGGDEIGPATGYLVAREQIDTGWARRWRIHEVLPSTSRPSGLGPAVTTWKPDAQATRSRP